SVVQSENIDVFRDYDPRTETLSPYIDYWVHFRIKNQLDIDRDWILALGKVSEADVFVSRDSRKFIRRRSGQLLPVFVKDISGGRFNQVNLFMAAQEELEIFVRFRNDVNYPPDLNIRLINKHSWQEDNARTNLFQGFFQGLLWMMLLHNLLLFIRTLDRAYLSYVFYIMAVSVYLLNFYGYWGEFFAGQVPFFNFLYLPFTAYLAFILYMQFLRFYLNTPLKLPVWDMYIKIIIGTFIVATGIMIFLAIMDYQAYMLIEKYVVSGIFLIIFLIACIIFIRGNLIAQYFALGTASMLAGGIILLLGSSRVLDIPYNHIFYELGILGEVIIFSLGLSERYRESEKTKKQMRIQLIEQLEKNRAIQLKSQQELEAKVQRRTLEIENQKEEILVQREEISKQKDKLEQQKNLLTQKNSHITDSIVYASRIQKAILYDYDILLNTVKEGFIFYAPKDIVSGDFYWYNEINTYGTDIDQFSQEHHARFLGSPLSNKRKEVDTILASPMSRDLKVIVVGDCTGHGVPGAFMTVMGNSLLNEIIMENRIVEPDRVLSILDRKIIKTLSKQGSDEQISDGMEISILVYDEMSRQVHFSGTGNALYLIRDYDIHTFKPSRYSIGYSNFHKSKEFEKTTIDLQEDDIFYLATDGFQDQFGGRYGRKYMKKNFRKLLLNISHLPMEAQKKRLEKSFVDWRKGYTQTDDITIMGLKFF
ncbi:MAG: 7TM diverse intracellular signaling domain-containing protein, partial [Bacteroidota bacterium]